MTKDFSLFFSEKIDVDTNIIWFERSNKYIIVNDLLNNLILNKIDHKKYPLNELLSENNESNSVNLKTINKEIDALLEECNKKELSTVKEQLSLENKQCSFYSKFKFNKKVIKIEYSDENLRNLIDPKFQHLKSQDKEDIIFKVQEKNKRIYLFKDDKYIGSWGANEMHEFQGKVSMELTSFFHNMQDSDWTAVFHGSTLSKENNCLMLTGDSGNGKSSLSTILMANNFSLVADDFSPMNKQGFHYNFPSAISVKEGFYKVADNLFTSFSKLNEYYISDIKGNVKYLPQNNNPLILNSKCNRILNVKFGGDLKNEIRIVNKGKALEKILPDAWISKDIEHARSFISWVNSSIFYDLTYNDNEKVLKMINEIL